MIVMVVIGPQKFKMCDIEIIELGLPEAITSSLIITNH